MQFYDDDDDDDSNLPVFRQKHINILYTVYKDLDNMDIDQIPFVAYELIRLETVETSRFKGVKNCS